MKRPKQDDRGNNGRHRRIKRLRTRSTRNDPRITELLKLCLEKVCELQADLQRNDEEENDPEAAGYAACAVETVRFLCSEGMRPDHPVVKTLTQHLLRDRNDFESD